MNLFDIAKLKNELSNLEKETLKDGFWNDSKNSSIILQKIKTIKSKVEKYNKLTNELDNLIEMSELVSIEVEGIVASNESSQDNEDSESNSLVKDIIDNTKSIQSELEDLEIQTLLSGKYDINNAIVTIHPGAGGTESQDWAEMLYRMYTRWANSERIYSPRIRLFRW